MQLQVRQLLLDESGEDMKVILIHFFMGHLQKRAMEQTIQFFYLLL